MNEYFTWDMLGTYAGAILAVTLMTQFVKGLGFVKKIPTRIVSYVFSIIVMILALVFTGTITVSACVLTLINAVIVSVAANGTYDALTDDPSNPPLAVIEDSPVIGFSSDKEDE